MKKFYNENNVEVKEQRPIKIASAEDVAHIIKNSSSVIIVPGYGMAVAGGMHLRQFKAAWQYEMVVSNACVSRALLGMGGE